jgi:YesN/AraC family two-component response regulator
MVCIRCKIVVKDELTKLGIHYTVVELGEVNIMENISEEQKELFKIALLKVGLELMDDRKSMLIQKIKNTIIDLAHYSEEPLKINLSDYLSQKLHHDFHYLSNLFSSVQGVTIEKFYISHKIERVKELLVYNEFSLTDIAYMMHYCSVSHLSNQFKKVTGLTPSHFKGLKEKKRFMLEDL